MISEHKLRAIEEQLTSAMCDDLKMSPTEIADFAVRELRALVCEYRKLTSHVVGNPRLSGQRC